jgi:hypothetical protein
MTLPIPDGYSQVTEGSTNLGDLCAIPTVKGVKMAASETKHKGNKIIPGEWELVFPEHIGRPISQFRAVIRRISL